jgi:hypothetical protein
MHKHYKKFACDSPGPQDIFDYGIGNLWRKGIDGAGTGSAGKSRYALCRPRRR